MRGIVSFSFIVVAVVAGACVGSEPETVVSAVDSGTLGDAGGSTPSSADDASTADAETCPNQMCSGACVDTSSSGDHCGRCGHSCGGGTCKSGVCAPVVVASNVTQPFGVAVAATSVFWIRNGAIERCPVTGCTGAPATITDEVTIGAGQPGGTTIATDGNEVAWIANGSSNGRNVFACSVAGCTNGSSPKAATGLTDAPTQLALEGSTIFVSQATGTQRQGPLSTLALTGIAGAGSDVPTGIAADKVNVYVAGVRNSAMGVDRCERPSCASSTRMFLDAKYLAVGGSLVLATAGAGIMKCAATGCGGAATALAPDDKTAVAIAADDGFVAWAIPGSDAASDGTIRVCALPDCKDGPRTVAEGQDHPVSVTIADGFVYWANRGAAMGKGSIWRAAL